MWLTSREKDEMFKRAELGAIIARTVPPDERTDEEWCSIFAYLALTSTKRLLNHTIMYTVMVIGMLICLILK